MSWTAADNSSNHTCVHCSSHSDCSPGIDTLRLNSESGPSCWGSVSAMGLEDSIVMLSVSRTFSSFLCTWSALSCTHRREQRPHCKSAECRTNDKAAVIRCP
eukprot:3937300-Rhodomonas_salina.2